VKQHILNNTLDYFFWFDVTLHMTLQALRRRAEQQNTYVACQNQMCKN